MEQAAIKVTGMELCAATVTAKNDPEAGRMIPAWKVCFHPLRQIEERPHKMLPDAVC